MNGMVVVYGDSDLAKPRCAFQSSPSFPHAHDSWDRQGHHNRDDPDYDNHFEESKTGSLAQKHACPGLVTHVFKCPKQGVGGLVDSVMV
jgi:hypothetical protein